MEFQALYQQNIWNFWHKALNQKYFENFGIKLTLSEIESEEIYRWVT